MNLVAIDNHLLVWGIREHVTAGQEEMVPRTQAFLEDCRKNGTKIVIPTVVVGEFLSAISPADHAMAINLLKSGYLLVPYDAACASLFAKIWREQKNKGVVALLQQDMQATRQELKADCMIVATAVTSKAECIYSHDGKLAKFAEGYVDVREIPRVTSQTEMELAV